MKRFTFMLMMSLLFMVFTIVNLTAQTDWKKYSDNPVLDPGPSGAWDAGFVGIPSVLFDGDTYHMWYSNGIYGNFARSIGYATSPDGITWTKYDDSTTTSPPFSESDPVLFPGQPGAWDDEGATASSVLLIDTTYHMWYGGSDDPSDHAHEAIGHATSNDGINWEKDTLHNPVLIPGTAGSWDDVWIYAPSVLFDGAIYHMWYMAYNGIDEQLRIGHGTSPDGITWTKNPNNPVLSFGAAGSWDYPRVDFPSVIYDGNTYHMWYSGGAAFAWQIGYAASPDGRVWTKDAANPVLEWGEAGSWEDTWVGICSVVLDSASSTYKMWYTGGDGVWDGHIGYAAPKKLGHYTVKEWAAVIDSTWGPGLPTADKLKIFDLFWNTIDEDFGGFHNLDVNWDSLRNVIRPEIEAGVSRGRFYGIMTHLYLALKETHTKILDLDVYHEELKPGIPLLVYQSGYYYTDNGHFGAGLTPLPDGSLLVYKVIEDHPLGLEPGDIILGYGGIPWKNLYRELLDAQFPVTSHTEPFASFGTYVFGGSSDRSVEHIWLMSVGLNWHLFEIIDIVKYGSNDTLHLSTSALIGMDAQLLCTEQMPIPGVPMPDLGNTNVSWITWGIVEGTEIGYIYVPSWVSQFGDDIAFTNAVNTLLDDYQATGLIIDSRINAGGQTQTANGGFSRLFNFDPEQLEFAERSDPNDHFAMRPVTSGECSSQYWKFHPDSFLYNRPIAVLSGPASWSAGDDNALRLKFHPMVRFFGKPANTGYTCFTSFNNLNIPYQGWFGQYAPQNGFLADDPDNYLMHVGFEVDEEVWLTQEDVVKGEDTVVKRAIEWIITNIDDQQIGQLPFSYELSQNYPNPFNPKTIISYQLAVGGDVELNVYNLLGQKVATLVTERQNAGYHQVEWNAGDLSSGIYYYRIEAGEFQDVKKMILLR